MVKEEKERVGWYISVLKFRFIILPAISLAAGVLLALLIGVSISLISWLVGSDFTGNVWMYLGIVVLGFALTFKSSGKTFTVPNEHVAVLTLFGQRLDWYLEEGEYNEFGEASIFGRSTEVKNGFTTDASHPNGPGFVNMGIIPFQIWNNRKDKLQRLENISQNNATVFATLLLEVKVFYPRLVLSAGDPLLSLAERARTAFRTAISFFIDRDNASVKSLLVKLMIGKTIVTSFVNHKDGAHFNQGAMIRSRDGTALQLEVASNNSIGDLSKKEAEADYQKRVKKAKKDFRKEKLPHADETMLAALPTKEGEIVVKDKSVEDSLEEVLNSVGTYLHNASISNVEYSAQVKQEADHASSENFKHKSMQDSARAQADAEELLDERRKSSGVEVDEFDKVIIAAQDNPGSVKIIHTSGNAGEISKAASIIASKDDTGKDSK